MLVNFLQRRPVPVLPSLQDMAFARHLAPVYVQGHDCRYIDDLAEVEQELVALRGSSAANAESTAFLVFEFLRFYGQTYRSGVVTIRDTTAYVANYTGNDDAYLNIDNPFEVGKDVANV